VLLSAAPCVRQMLVIELITSLLLQCRGAPCQRVASGYGPRSAISDTRVRVGNPIVAELLSQDPALARIFHRASPSQDPGMFGEAIARHIAIRGAETLSPQAHGERLAAMLLPDVLPFDPAFPVGYTFANQNGRRPSDPIAEVVATVLAGAVTARPLAKEVFRAAPAFPYFEILEV
jgi:hypothetical protein